MGLFYILETRKFSFKGFHFASLSDPKRNVTTVLKELYISLSRVVGAFKKD
jgi:hypothetical protein